jgi:L-phenylalanine/L-methionine N-acetyltransferase
MEETEIVIRAQEPGDGEAIAWIASGQNVIHGTLQIPYQPIEFWRKRAAETPPDRIGLVAEVDGKVVGAIGIHLSSAHRMRHAAEIGMMVHDDYQGRGVGRALVEAVIDLADNWLNLHRIGLQVYADNDVAIHLYERCGFVIEGTMRDYVFRNGQYVDAYMMSRVRPRPDER